MRLTHLTLLASLLSVGCSTEPTDEPNDTDTDTDADTDTDTDIPEVEGLELIGLDFILDDSVGYDPSPERTSPWAFASRVAGAWPLVFTPIATPWMAT